MIAKTFNNEKLRGSLISNELTILAVIINHHKQENGSIRHFRLLIFNTFSSLDMNLKMSNPMFALKYDTDLTYGSLLLLRV